MTGAFLIIQTNGMSMSGVEFTHIVEALRRSLKDQSQESLEAAYRSMDESGMDFVSLESLDRNGSRHFTMQHAKRMTTNRANPQARRLKNLGKIYWTA